MSGSNLILILGSVRDGRMVERVSTLVIKAVQKHTKMAVTVVDPLKLEPGTQLNRQPMHFLGGSEKVPEWMKNTNETFTKANGFLLLSTEYNGMMPPALMNLLNTFPPMTFRHRPCGIITYTMGTTGAMRALNNVRPYAAELGMLIVPGYVPIPQVHESVDTEGSCSNQLINGNLEMLLKNVEWYAQAIQKHQKENPLVN